MSQPWLPEQPGPEASQIVPGKGMILTWPFPALLSSRWRCSIAKLPVVPRLGQQGLLDPKDEDESTAYPIRLDPLTAKLMCRVSDGASLRQVSYSGSTGQQSLECIPHAQDEAALSVLEGRLKKLLVRKLP